jgi:hypothetical protein
MKNTEHKSSKFGFVPVRLLSSSTITYVDNSIHDTEHTRAMYPTYVMISPVIVLEAKTKTTNDLF